MIALSCQPLVFGLSPCIQIVTVCLLAGVSRTPPPFLGKLSNVEFCEVRGAICKLPPSPGLCAYIYLHTYIPIYIYMRWLYGSIHIGGGGFPCIHSLQTHTGFCCSELRGRCLPEPAQHFQSPPERGLRVHHLGQGGFTQQPVMPQLAITCLHPTSPALKLCFTRT